MMKVASLTLAVTTGVLTLTAQMPSIAHADQTPTAPCVSGRELDQVQVGMSRHRVHEVFDDFRGKRVDYRRRGASSDQDDTFREQVIRSYGGCRGKAILIGYESRTVDGERGRFRVVRMRTMSL